MPAWSYSGDPSTSDLDMVRFLIGDTDETDQQLTDAEILAMIAAHTPVTLAAAVCAEVLTAKFARLVSKSIDGLSLTFGDQQRNYADLAKRLRRMASLLGAAPYCASISVSEKEAVVEDSDRVKPAFTVDMHEEGSTTDSEEE